MVNWETVSLTEDVLKVDKETLYGEGVNAAFYGITISRSGSIQFGQLISEEIGVGKDLNTIDLSLIEGQGLLITVSKDSGSINNTERKKRHFASKRHISQLLKNGGTEEVKKRWYSMFKADVTTDLKSMGYGKSYRFSIADTKEKDGDGLYKRGDNIFLIDLLAGKANNTGEDD